MTRVCAHANTHGIARSASRSSTVEERETGRDAIGSDAICRIGVTRVKKRANPGASTNARYAAVDARSIAAISSANGAERSGASSPGATAVAAAIRSR